jgi:DNA-binding NarL/FixJ family response regulator
LTIVAVDAEHARRTMNAATGSDPEAGLTAVVALRQLVELLEQRQVANARTQGWSWQDIAVRLGVSKQAVHYKHWLHRHDNKQ